MEKKINERNKYFTVFENIVEPVIIIDSNYVIQEINPAAETFLDITKEYAKGKLCNEILHCTICPQDCQLKEAINNSMKFSGIEKEMDIKGKKKIVLMNCSFIQDFKGRNISGVAILTDITKIKNLEEGIKYLNHKISVIKKEEEEGHKFEEHVIQMQKMESLGALASGIAHDFNNLLGGILGYASLLITKIPKNSAYYHDVENILSITNRASDLTSKILAYVRKEKDNIRLININNIVNEVVSLLSRTIERRISIEKYLEEELFYVMGDENQIQQAFLNVCINARDAMPGGGILTIRTENVTLKESFIENYIGIGSGDYILITISDTGIGMDEKVRKRIFEPFFTTKQKKQGTGLGLSIVYEIIKGHDGYITVDSKLGKGTTLKIYLPAVKSQTSEIIDQEEKKISTGNGTVLIVDDEEIIRNLIREILERFGYKVFTASNGEEAIDIYTEMKDKIDIIILDMIMPGIGGKRTFSKLKEINSKANILLMSGYKKNGETQEALNEGALGFLQKPFNVNDLIKAIKMILHHSGACK
ncbi:MAG: response regulator [Acidobacteriota bacterium]